MKFLCVCHYGHSRSVALTRVLHALKQEAVAVGYGTAKSSIPYIGAWADRILWLEDSVRLYVEQLGFGHKLINFNVGPDVWSNPYSTELLFLLGQMVRTKLIETGIIESV